MQEAIYIGTLLFFILGLGGCIGVGYHVTHQTVQRQAKFENRA